MLIKIFVIKLFSSATTEQLLSIMKHLCKHGRKKCIFLSEVSVVEVTPWMSICRAYNSNTRNLFWLFPIQSSAGVDVDEGTRPVPTTVKLSRCLSWIRRNLSSLVGQTLSVPPVNGSSLLIGRLAGKINV